MVCSQSLFSVLILAFLMKGSHCQVDDPALDINPNAPRTRGNKFALAFMNNNAEIPSRSQQQLGLFVTTEQESSTYTIQTRFPGVADSGFTETSTGSGLWSRTEVAVRGRFTFTSFPAGGTDPPRTFDGVVLPDIAVQDNGQGDTSDRLKGVIVEAEDPTHELTVYMLSDESVSADAFMAINCVEFPTASNYQYYVFSSLSVVERTPFFASRFLVTFCEDDTEISVRPALPQTHPDWVNPEFSNTDPQSPNQDETTYFRRFNRFDTIMLSNNVRNADLTGSIVTANRPVSVFVGHQCGTPGGILTCDYLVEQVPPHATYGDLFYLAPFRFRETGEIYRIGSLNSRANVMVTINDCNCLPSSESVPRVALQGTGSVQTAALERGQYVECRTPEDTQTFCSIQSSHPVTVMAYTLGNRNDVLNTLPFPLDRLNSPIADPAMVYIPPATSYLNSYTATTAKNLTTQFQGLISYILPARIFDNSEEDQNRFRVNGEVNIPTDGYQPINCGNPPEVCAYGANMALGQGEFNFTYDDIGDGAFWGYAYGYAREVSFAYPLAFEMEPTGLAWIRAIDRVVLESDTEVDLGFEIVRGDRSSRTRAFAYTDGGSAIPGEDYTSVGTRPGEGNSNLRWRRTAQFPNNPFTVQINDDDIPEPVEVVEVQVRCEANEHCYSPRSSYTITIIDDQGECPTLPENPIANLLRIDYTYDLDPPFPRHPFGTVATYICQDGFTLIGNEMRTCGDGVWSGTEPRCVPNVVGAMLSFAADAFSYVENEGMGILNFTLSQSFGFDIDFTLTSVPTYSAGTVAVSAPNLPTSLTFPSGQTSYQVSFPLNDDQIGLELDETYDLTITLAQSAIDAGVSVVEGGDMAQLTVEDDDLVTLSVAELDYSVTEDEGFVEISYVLNRQALMDVTFDVVNVDGSATGGLVDYDSAGYTLTIPAGQREVSRNITIVEDGIPGEEDEEFTNRIDSVSTSGVSIGQRSSVVTIIDSTVPVSVMFDRSSYTFIENEGRGLITVVTDGRPAPFAFMFNVNGGPSIQPFVINSGGSVSYTDTFPEGAQSLSFEITLTDDSVALEELESYIATLTLASGTPGGVILGSPDQATIEIEDNDEYTVGFVQTASSVEENAGPAVLEIVSTPAARDVDLSVGTITGGTAISPDDYTAIDSLGLTIPAGDTSVSFNINIADDEIVEGDETVIAQILQTQPDGLGEFAASPNEHTLTILDNDEVIVGFDNSVYSFDEGSGTGSVTIVKQGSTEFDFDIRVSGGPSDQSDIVINADGIESTLTFPADQQSITISFAIGDDDVGLEDIERYIAMLEIVGSPIGVVLGQREAEVQVIDDDVVSVGFGVDSVTVMEMSGQFMMCVRLDRLAAVDVEVDIESIEETATAGVDYDPNSIPSQVTIVAGTNETCFTGIILDDNEPGEGPESFMLIIRNVEPPGVEIFRINTTVIIRDSDVGMCEELSSIPNGVISYRFSGEDVSGMMFEDGTVATYSCNNGYVLEGASMRTCVVLEGAAEGEFDGVAPQCVPLCDELSQIPNGVITYSTDMNAPFSVGTVATYSCNGGYELTFNPGNEMRTCTNLGGSLGAEFDGDEPRCLPVCPALGDIPNGVITYSTDMNAPFSVGTVATYSCNGGYELTFNPGNEMRTCTNLGGSLGAEFDGDEPRCLPVCPALGDIPNGVITYSTDMNAPFSVGTVATYSCNEGYELTFNPGNEMRTCTNLGGSLGAEFDGDEPRCRRLLCPPLPPIENGTITYAPDTSPDYEVGTVATYECEDDFNLVGNAIRVCQSDGTFNGTLPVCTQIPVCAELAPLANGRIVYSEGPPRGLGTVATHICDSGFYLNGVMTRECVLDATNIAVFDETAPTCDPIECPALPPLINGMITYGSDDVAPYALGTVATHICNRGYMLVGTQTRVCENVGAAEGEWSEEPPICEPVTCPDLPSLPNGEIGYDMPPPRPVDTVATYVCDEGFELEGQAIRTCGEDGMFSGQPPRCTPLCPAITPSLVNGEIDYSSADPDASYHPIGTVAVHECIDGYELEGPENRTCREINENTAEFDQEPPRCVPVCDEITEITNLIIEYNPQPSPTSPVGGTATIRCNEGFRPVGPEDPLPLNVTLVCVEVTPGGGGEFEVQGIEGSTIACEPTCIRLPEIPNGQISYAPDMEEPYDLGTVATYICDPGYELVTNPGDAMRTCVNASDGSGGRFDGSEPFCQRSVLNFTTCMVDEPMMVSPFTRSTSYRFMGSCEHVLLQSCNQNVDFEVRMDFITSSNEHGAVGVFSAGEYCIITENGDFSSSTPGVDLGPNPDGNQEISYPVLNTIKEFGLGFIEIRVGGGIGVSVRYTRGDPPNVLVTVNSGSSLGETCGLCGTQTGELRRPDGSIADITDPAQVEAFSMEYLTPGDQQTLRPIRRECAMLRNDTIIGDPLYSVALTNNGPGPSTMCYEVRGSANQHYNLVSDTCVNVNALYSPMNEPENGNIMSVIGVRAVPNDGFCINIQVSRDGCSATAIVFDQGFIIDENNPTFSMGGVSVRRYPNRVRISAPNCDEVTLVMWVQCVTVGDQDMLHFVISRGVNLRPTSHGLLGQFWNIPAFADVFPSGSGNFYTVRVEPSDDPQSHRSFLAETYSRTWDKRPLQCLYAGNSQGGPYNELQDPVAPSDSIIQGNFRTYRVDFLHDSDWAYNEFEESRCPALPTLPGPEPTPA